MVTTSPFRETARSRVYALRGAGRESPQHAKKSQRRGNPFQPIRLGSLPSAIHDPCRDISRAASFLVLGQRPVAELALQPSALRTSA